MPSGFRYPTISAILKSSETLHLISFGRFVFLGRVRAPKLNEIALSDLSDRALIVLLSHALILCSGLDQSPAHHSDDARLDAVCGRQS
jgi:hypothetical protein